MRLSSYVKMRSANRLHSPSHAQRFPNLHDVIEDCVERDHPSAGRPKNHAEDRLAISRREPPWEALFVLASGCFRRRIGGIGRDCSEQRFSLWIATYAAFFA
jgi:hypothetical protein